MNDTSKEEVNHKKWWAKRKAGTIDHTELKGEGIGFDSQTYGFTERERLSCQCLSARRAEGSSIANAPVRQGREGCEHHSSPCRFLA